jgi:actinin alpha
MESAEEAAGDPINCNYVEDAERLIAEFAQIEKQRDERKADYQSLVDLAGQMKQAGITDFSGVTIDDITAKWKLVLSTMDQRRAALQQEFQRQKANDAICREFASQAQNFSSWLKQQRDQLGARKGDLQQQLDGLRAQQTQFASHGKESLDKLEATNKKVEAARVKHNKHTDLTLRTLSAEYEQLDTALDKQATLLTNEIMAKKNADVTPEQLKEFKEVFNHFDRDGNGMLAKIEFKACLQTLGDEPSDSELDNIMRGLDPEGKGVSFDKFTEHMVKRTKDSDTTDEIMESFKALANDKEFVTETDLRKVLTNDRVAYLISHMPKYKDVEGGYDYRAWVEQAYAK